jgi:hypothetical protein
LVKESRLWIHHSAESAGFGGQRLFLVKAYQTPLTLFKSRANAEIARILL